MELQLKITSGNLFPYGGILIKGSSPQWWLSEVKRMGLSLFDVQMYPLPGITANSVWGCLAVHNRHHRPADLGSNSVVQLVSGKLFIPEYSTIYPKLGADEIEKLFPVHPCMLHPEFGLVELKDAVVWEELIRLPAESGITIYAPEQGEMIPRFIHSFQMRELPPEELLEKFEKGVVSERKKMEDKPLNPVEKTRLEALRKLFKKTKGSGGQEGDVVEPTPLLEKAGWLARMFTRNDRWKEKLQSDFEDLEKRNQKAIDKLMDMLRNDPSLALQYAIPLDEYGTSRGEPEGVLKLSRIWNNLSPGGSRWHRPGGGSVNIGDHYYRLQNQYHETANQLKEKGEYEKAAFIYLKLLKNVTMAAESLEQGKLYAEAAAIYLKQPGMKRQAAQCYEKGNMILPAIELYKELEENEKVADLYMRINMKAEAGVFYDKVIDRHCLNHKYLKASLVCTGKLNDVSRAQEILLKGWRSNSDAFNCLNHYFSNVENAPELKKEMLRIYDKETDDGNVEVFLRVLEDQYTKDPRVRPLAREIAYSIVAARVAVNPSIVTGLRAFNKEDRVILRDILWYKRAKGNGSPGKP